MSASAAETKKLKYNKWKECWCIQVNWRLTRTQDKTIIFFAFLQVKLSETNDSEISGEKKTQRCFSGKVKKRKAKPPSTKSLAAWRRSARRAQKILMSTQIQLKRIYSCFTRNVIIFVLLHLLRFTFIPCIRFLPAQIHSELNFIIYILLEVCRCAQQTRRSHCMSSPLHTYIFADRACIHKWFLFGASLPLGELKRNHGFQVKVSTYAIR